MDLATKGEQPFANLIREQLLSARHATKQMDDRHPNEGRKAYSLAMVGRRRRGGAEDLPREVERDSFREAWRWRSSNWQRTEREAIPDETLYRRSSPSVLEYYLHFFDGRGSGSLIEDSRRFEKDYERNLGSHSIATGSRVATHTYRTGTTSPNHRSILLIGSRPVPRRSNPVAKKLRILERRIGSNCPTVALSEMSGEFVRQLLGLRHAFDPNIERLTCGMSFPNF